MISRYTIFLSLLLVQSISNSQTYSPIIPDRDIEEILDCEIRQMLSILDSDKFATDKIDIDIVDWRKLDELNIDSLHLIEDILQHEAEDTLKTILELFSDKDFTYMTLQGSQNSGRQWQLPRSSIKFVKRCRKDCTRFSIPLFNETHTMAIIYVEEIYNPIAACGLIKVFVLEDFKWREYKSLCVWLM